MADFYEVHGKAIDAHGGRLHLGDIWNVQIREPLATPMPLTDQPGDLIAKVVRFRAERDGRLRPATVDDRREIYEWNKRHRETPLDWFGLPAGLLEGTR